MKRVLIGLVVACVFEQANATNWVFVHRDESSANYMDSDSLSRDGDVVEFMERAVYSVPQIADATVYTSTIQQVSIRCSDKTTRFISVSGYDMGGKNVLSAMGDGQWHSSAAGSVAREFVDKACHSHARGKRK
jgi:hypothetical protein